MKSDASRWGKAKEVEIMNEPVSVGIFSLIFDYIYKKKNSYKIIFAEMCGGKSV